MSDQSLVAAAAGQPEPVKKSRRTCFKAKSAHDPDLPTLRESLCGPHAEQFWTAMDAEIASLERKGAWTVVD